MSVILGISAFFHDSAATLVVDGRIVAAAQEERFTRRRHEPGFPTAAIAACLESGGRTAAEIDYVGFYEKPLTKFDRLLQTYLSGAPRGLRSFSKAMPSWLTEKLLVNRAIRRSLPEYHRRVVYANHHESHAASAFFPSPFDEAAILTIDGVGEWQTASLGTGRGNQIETTAGLRFPHSLGLLYSAFTYHCGFKVDSGEYKLMGLAPYGTPVYADLIRRELIDLKADGSFHLNLKYFDYCHGLRMTSPAFDRLFGQPRRQPESPLRQHDKDIAASIQCVTEEVVIRMATKLHRDTGMKNLCMAGGVALNCAATGKLKREGPFEQIWVQPAAGDAGGSLGVATLIEHQLLGRPRTHHQNDAQQGSLLGPSFSSDRIAADLTTAGAVFETYGDDEHGRADLDQAVAALLNQGHVVGWMQGRMEFGPRALGARSILADPRNPAMQETVNRKIKFRESFRPFAPAVLRSHASEWFDVQPDERLPYMSFVAPVHPHRRTDLPAVTHVDGTARIQTVDEEAHPRLQKLLAAFHQQSGCPVLINTSFNVRGEPIVCTPADAFRCFMATEMDVLVIENYLCRKPNQTVTAKHGPSFAPD